MSLHRLLNELDLTQQQELLSHLSKKIIKDPHLDQASVWKSLSVLETMLALNIRFDFNQYNLIIDNHSKFFVQKEIENHFNLSLNHIYLSNHPSDVLGVSLAIALESSLKTLVLMDDFSMNYGKSFESLIQLNNHKPDLSIVFFDPYDSLFESKPAMNLWLNNLRMSNTYASFKKDLKSFLSNPVGMPILETLTKVKEGFKGVLIEPSIFTQFGFNYHGPITGSDFKENLKAFKNLKDFEGMHLIHVNSNIESLQNLQLPSFKLEDGIPDNYVSYLDAVDEALSSYDDVIVCTDISKNKEHMPQFAIKYPDHYYVSTGTIQSFVDFAKGLSMLHERVVFVVSSYQFKHVIPLVEEQLSKAKNILFILRDSGLREKGNRITQGVFDVGFSALITKNIYMGKDIHESVGILKHILSQDSFDLSILRIPNTHEKHNISDDDVTSDWDVYLPKETPRAIIFTYGPSVQQLLRKIEINHMNVGVVNCKKILSVDFDLIEYINKNDIPVAFYDLEDLYHTLYGSIEPLIHSTRIYNYNLKHTDLNMSARDLKMKYNLTIEHVLKL